jgi:hypothetical protein
VNGRRAFQVQKRFSEGSPGECKGFEGSESGLAVSYGSSEQDVDPGLERVCRPVISACRLKHKAFHSLGIETRQKGKKCLFCGA